MAWRAIQNTVGTSESLAALSDLAERLYWRILALSDPWGRLDARPRKLRAACYPMLPHITDEAAGLALLELQRAERISVWQKDDRQPVLQVLDFEENQPREAFRKRPPKSRFPDPPSALKAPEGLIERLYGIPTDDGDETPVFAGDSGPPPDPFRNVSGALPDERRRDEKRRENVKSKDLKQQQSSKGSLNHVAREHEEEPETAAADQLEAPRESEIQQFVESIPGHDAGTLKQVLPLARTLPRHVFQQIADQHRQRTSSGHVRNPTGLLVQLLRTVHRDLHVRAVADQQAAIASWTVSDALEAQARSYARSGTPWDAARELLALKLRREAPDEEPDDLLERARIAYEARPQHWLDAEARSAPADKEPA